MAHQPHTVRKIIFWLLLLLFLAAAFFFIWQYIKFRNSDADHPTFIVPRIESSKFTITDLNRERTLMDAEVVLRNSLPLNFRVDSLHYTLFISGVPVAKSRRNSPFEMHSNDTTLLKLPMIILFHDLDSVLRIDEKQEQDSVDYTVKARFYSDLPFKKDFEISFSKYWPLFHYPIIEVEKMKIDSFNLRRAKILLHVKVTNKNLFAIRLKDISYRLGIEGHRWMEGYMPGITELPAKSTVELIFPARISLKEVGRTTMKLLVKGKTVDYKMHTTFYLEAGNNMLRDSKVTLEGTGTVQSLLDFKGD